MMKAVIGFIGIIAEIGFWIWMVGLGAYFFWVEQPSMHLLGLGLGTVLLKVAGSHTRVSED